MLALLAAAAVLSSPPPARPAAAPGSGAGEVEPYTAKEMAWQKANLDTQGWTLVTVGGDVLIFLGSAPRAADGDPMIAVRGEHYPFAQTNSIGGGESFLSRDEIDCAKTMERTVSSTVYKDSGLQGNIASASDDPGPWRAIKDATFLAAAYKALCPGGSAAR
jgi:hypothetical protein